ncbi:MAG: ORF6N domain-containing protein, partial [Candidatus Marinimicrobia bacterium]|nr:ORF6N domain-containing protein [Candidatus Neomarinimicrobiota bacterium]
MINDIISSEESIIDLIYKLRDKSIMLDRDLAKFYDVKPFRLREQVKRNMERFPDDFMFRLTDAEVDIMVSQNAIPSKQVLGGSSPYAFTEQGVAAISSILTSKRAIEVSIMIMRSFVSLRKSFKSNCLIDYRVSHLEKAQIRTEQDINFIFNALNQDKEIEQGIFYKGQIFDAFSFVSKIIRSANSSIVLIDNYIDDTVFTQLNKRKTRVKLKIITQNRSKQVDLDVKKYTKQYSGF